MFPPHTYLDKILWTENCEEEEYLEMKPGIGHCKAMKTAHY